MALALPEDHCDNIKDKVLCSGLGAEKLKQPDGAKELLKYLDSFYKQDDFVVHYSALKKLENFRRVPNDSIEKYIAEFKELVVDAEKKGMAYSDQIKAFMLLEKSRTGEIEKQMIVSQVKYEKDQDNIFCQM